MSPARASAPATVAVFIGKSGRPPAPRPHLPPDPLTSRPNDGSGYWPDFSNTGYSHAPGYSPVGGNCVHGYLGVNDYAGGMTANSLLYVDEAPGTVFNFTHFRGTILLGHTTGDNWTFNGCIFDNAGESTGSADFITQTYLPTFYEQNYCTFKPCDYMTPPGNNGLMSSAVTSPGTPCASSWQSFNTNVNGSQTGEAVVVRSYCDIWGNAGMQDVFFGTSGSPVIIDHCYIHDQADTDDSGGCGYHQDGIGPSPDQPSIGYLQITNSTLASLGNTNAIAFQLITCHDMQITGNYLCGWGDTVNLGGTDGPAQDFNINFTGNVFSAEVPYLFAPMYANWSWDSTTPAMVWRNNRWQFFAGDSTGGGMNLSFQGQYWWPSDDNAHASDYTG